MKDLKAKSVKKKERSKVIIAGVITEDELRTIEAIDQNGGFTPDNIYTNFSM